MPSIYICKIRIPYKRKKWKLLPDKLEITDPAVRED